MAPTGEKIRELAEAEAARAEAEPDDDEAAEAEADETPEPHEHEPAAPEPPAGPPVALSPDSLGELEKATTAYYKRAEKAFGGVLPPECPACNGLGFDLSGGGPVEDFRVTDEFKACEACNGLGKLKTGSRVPGHDLRDCPTCQGRGYLEKLGPVPVPFPVPAQDPPAPPSEAQYGVPAWMGDVTPGQ